MLCDTEAICCISGAPRGGAGGIYRSKTNNAYGKMLFGTVFGFISGEAEEKEEEEEASAL